MRRTTRRVDRDALGFIQDVAGIKKATKAAQGAASTAANTGAKYGSEAEDIGSTLVPAVKGDITHPQGFSPEDRNAMLVAGEQGAGGATGSLVGEAGLEAARTHNTGSLSALTDELARTKTRQLSENALNVQAQNAALKEKKRAAAMGQAGELYGTDVNAGLKAQNLVPEDINAWANANKTGWLQNTTDIMNSLTGGANAAANMKKAGFFS
jgi:hypothetical protein